MNSSSLWKPLLGVSVATVLLLLIPAAAMQFSDEVRWGPGDFAVAGGLLLITGTAMVLAARVAKRRTHRSAIIASIAIAFLAVWAELAVGLFD